VRSIRYKWAWLLWYSLDLVRDAGRTATQSSLMAEPANVKQPQAELSPHARTLVSASAARGSMRLVRVFLAATAFGFFGVGAVLLGWLVLPFCWLAGGNLTRRRMRCQRMVQHAFRLFHAYMRFCRLVEFDPRKALSNADWPRGTPAILMANHPTLIDTPAILACLGTACCVVAPWFGNSILLRPLLQLCGHIVQKNDDLADAARVLGLARERLEAGHCLLIFPEGTRSPVGQLGAFQRGCFALALSTGVPVYPIAIRVRPRVLSGKTPWHDLPNCSAEYRLQPLEAWLPSAYPVTAEAARSAAQEVRTRLARHLGLCIQPQNP
jgi:1-acyl-sn-glycerol-3-phosphate acyltransferase